MQIAHYKTKTYCFGRTPKFILWLQGCQNECPGCIAPEWQKMEGGKELNVKYITDYILERDTEGIVISGGEPLLQYKELIKLMKTLFKNNKGIVLYSGFHWFDIKSLFPEVLLFSDVIIAGPYIEKYNRGKGLRGSENQQFHFLTERYTVEKDFFKTGDRMIEIDINDDALTYCGIPPLDAKILVE